MDCSLVACYWYDQQEESSSADKGYDMETLPLSNGTF